MVKVCHFRDSVIFDNEKVVLNSSFENGRFVILSYYEPFSRDFEESKVFLEESSIGDKVSSEVRDVESLMKVVTACCPSFDTSDTDAVRIDDFLVT